MLFNLVQNSFISLSKRIISSSVFTLAIVLQQTCKWINPVSRHTRQSQQLQLQDKPSGQFLSSWLVIKTYSRKVFLLSLLLQQAVTAGATFLSLLHQRRVICVRRWPRAALRWGPPRCRQPFPGSRQPPEAPRPPAAGALPPLRRPPAGARTEPGPRPHARRPGRGADGELPPSSARQGANGGGRAAAAPRASGAPQRPPPCPSAVVPAEPRTQQPCPGERDRASGDTPRPPAPTSFQTGGAFPPPRRLLSNWAPPLARLATSAPLTGSVILPAATPAAGRAGSCRPCCCGNGPPGARRSCHDGQSRVGPRRAALLCSPSGLAEAVGAGAARERQLWALLLPVEAPVGIKTFFQGPLRGRRLGCLQRRGAGPVGRGEKPGAICAIYCSVLNETRLELGSGLAPLRSSEGGTCFPCVVYSRNILGVT